MSHEKKRVVTFTQPGDVHACAVDHILRSKSVDSILVLTTDVLDRSRVSVGYTDDDVWFELNSATFPLSSVTSSWNRRMSDNFRIPDYAHSADIQHITMNTRSILIGIMRLLDIGFSVNPVASFRAHANKMNQLFQARLVGFRVPETIVSNNFEQISLFVKRYSRSCVKPYYTQTWVSANCGKMAMTAELTVKQMSKLPKESFELCPQIYQEFIKKKSEHRLTIFGNYAVSTRIETSGLTEKGAIDWRIDRAYRKSLSLSRLPEKVLVAARRLLKALGLRFGTIDIAETFDGDFVFFEVNESGQWLWQELYCDGCIILEPFTEFLIQADESFIWKSTARSNYELSYIIQNIENNEIYKSIMTDQRPDDILYYIKENY